MENWVEQLGLQLVQDPDLEKPVYRKPYHGKVHLNAELTTKSASVFGRPAIKRSLSRSKIAPLLGLSNAVYHRISEKFWTLHQRKSLPLPLRIYGAEIRNIPGSCKTRSRKSDSSTRKLSNRFSSWLPRGRKTDTYGGPLR